MADDKFNFTDFLKSFQSDKNVAGALHKLSGELKGTKTRATGESGAGLVRIVLLESGLLQRRIESLDIADELLKEPKAVIEELIKAAFNDASSKADQERKNRLTPYRAYFDEGEE